MLYAVCCLNVQNILNKSHVIKNYVDAAELTLHQHTPFQS